MFLFGIPNFDFAQLRLSLSRTEVAVYAVRDISVISRIRYSVVGFLETVWFLETPIRKLLQFLLNPVVIIF